MALHACEPTLHLCPHAPVNHITCGKQVVDGGGSQGGSPPALWGGARMCLGYNFALLEIKVFFSMLSFSKLLSHVLHT